jgi:hypothetical protein
VNVQDASEGEHAQAEPVVPPSRQLMNLVVGMWWSRAVSVAAELGVADHLVHGPQEVTALAGVTRAHAPSLYRLLRFLSGAGVFAEVGPGVFAQTTLSALLRTEGAGSLREEVLLLGGEWHWRAWGALGHAVRTGQAAIDHLFGQDLFSYFAAQDPQAGELFHRRLSAASHAAVLAAYDFADLAVVADIGGGRGTLLGALVAAYPRLRGLLVERPEVIAQVRASGMEGEGHLDERISLIGGDFFAAVPPADAYLLRKVIHDWSDEESARILANCRHAMQRGGRVLVVEQIVPPWNEWSSIKFGDLEMLVLTHGRERTEAEFRALFTTAGLRLERIVPTASEVSILEGYAADSS